MPEISLSGVGKWGRQAHPDHLGESFLISPDYARTGNGSLRVLYRESWGRWGNEKIRSELHAPAGLRLEIGQEYWIRYSVMLRDTSNNSAMIADTLWNAHVSQFHCVGAKGTSGVNMRASKWYVSFGATNWNEATGRYDCEEFEGPAITLGEWVDFIYHVRVSDGADGFVRVWMNATPDDSEPNVISTWGPNTYADLDPKIGVYRERFGAGYDEAEQFYDDYWIASGPGGWDLFKSMDWLNEDIPTTLTPAGSASYESATAPGTFTVEGAGADIWGTADQFHFTAIP